MKWVSDGNLRWLRRIFLVLVVIVVSVTVYYRQRFVKSYDLYHTVKTTDRPWLKLIKLAKEEMLNNSIKHEEYYKFFLEENITTGPADYTIADDYAPVDFDINGTDVLVFLHIQKTGGTGFGRQLVSNMKLAKECDILDMKKRKNCLRPNSETETWIFSRFSTGWACGLHAGWTELTECIASKMDKIDKAKKQRQFFYVTVLRNPVKRYISEWKHVQRGATWKSALFTCNGQQNQIPLCFSGSDWSGVTLDEFLSCPYNMAGNRQTRMLADLKLVKCYERWMNMDLGATEIVQLEEAMLESAKRNLQDITFFGLLEQQVKLQKLFEYTLPFKFKEDFVQFNLTRTSGFIPTDEEMERISAANHLDIRLYEFAVQLFEQRYRKIK